MTERIQSLTHHHHHRQNGKQENISDKNNNNLSLFAISLPSSGLVAVISVLVAVHFCLVYEGDFYTLIRSQFYNKPPPQAFMSTLEMIRDAGYPAELHKINTNDGYILSVYRIKHGIKNGSSDDGRKREPVILCHGLMSSSADWFFRPADEALPFLLADAGFEVWLHNLRGNDESRSHVNLTTDDLQFWDFSFEEMGAEDVPSLIHYILNLTGSSHVSYVGHSMGATLSYLAINHDSSLNSKIRKIVAYSPAIYFQNLYSPPFKFVMNFFKPSTLQKIANFWNGGRLLPAPFTDFLKKHGPNFCSGLLTGKLCRLSIFVTIGFSEKQTNNMTASLVYSSMPAETSMKLAIHTMQLYHSDKLEAFDYGKKENLKRYDSQVPRAYSLSAVTVPTLVLYGLNDWLTTAPDIERAIRELRNNQGSHAVADENFSHMDFLYGTDVKTLVYDPTLRFLLSP